MPLLCIVLVLTEPCGSKVGGLQTILTLPCRFYTTYLVPLQAHFNRGNLYRQLAEFQRAISR